MKGVYLATIVYIVFTAFNLGMAVSMFSSGFKRVFSDRPYRLRDINIPFIMGAFNVVLIYFILAPELTRVLDVIRYHLFILGGTNG